MSCWSFMMNWVLEFNSKHSCIKLVFINAGGEEQVALEK